MATEPNPVSIDSRPPAPSATIVVLRESAAELQVLLLKRADTGDAADRNSNAWVFPGGKVDKEDRELHEHCAALSDIEASRRLSLHENGLDYYVAAIRESFEEAGLLFAHRAAAALATLLPEWRARLHAKQLNLLSLCHETGIRLAVDRLIYFGHWVTPVGIHKRFDTRFFLAVAPDDQIAEPDGSETVAHLWINPGAAIADKTLKIPTVTHHTLTTLARFKDLASLLQWAREPRDIPLMLPRRAMGKNGLHSVLPHEPAWVEVGRLDPHGHGNASSQLVPGRAVQLSPRVIRVTADNGGIMTGPGTNTYLLGTAQNEWAVIDPGPPDATHVDAILAAAPGKIRWILVTHTHKDHSPAVQMLKAKTSATVYGQVAQHGEGQDASFVPDQVLHGGERLTLDQQCTLRVIHTPGHASNHLCYLLEPEKTLFTGDHIMQASTVVINPPDGNMSAYIASLRALLNEDIEWLAPGHGFLMNEPRRVVEGIIQHRFKREAKVIATMRAAGPANMDTLLVRVYDDVDPRLHPAARRSLLAHLIKLQEDGVAEERDGKWRLLSA